MNYIVVGLFLTLVSYDMNFFSDALNTTVSMDILPDFLGYLLIWFALEKPSANNKWLRFASAVNAGMLVISFVTFLSDVRFLYENLLRVDGNFLKIALGVLGQITKDFGNIQDALNLLFALCMAYAMAKALTEENHPVYGKIYGFLAVLCGIAAVLCVVQQFWTVLPFPLWAFTLPLSAIYLIYSYFAMPKLPVLA